MPKPVSYYIYLFFVFIVYICLFIIVYFWVDYIIIIFIICMYRVAIITLKSSYHINFKTKYLTHNCLLN